MKHKILLVEDNMDLGGIIKQYLELMDFEVEWCKDGESALEIYKNSPNQFQLISIDLQLPDINGFHLAEAILKEKSNIPFVFLTGSNEKDDRIKGLKLGADDYILKPFDIEEYVLRIKNIIRRSSSNDASLATVASILSMGDVVLQKHSLKLSIGNDTPVSITLREAELIEYLYHHKNIVLKREDLLLQLWGKNDYFLGRSLDVFISRIRKLLLPSKYISIHTVYGVGFIFNVKND